jgi:SAM-dependent methyltransferase
MEKEPQSYVLRNRASWDKFAGDYVEAGKRAWTSTDPFWGIWSVPEKELRILPEVSGLDVIELGCGTSYVSYWLKMRNANVMGIDNSMEQLKTALALQKEHKVDFPIMQGNAEQTPFPDKSFDLAISEYGACIWCDPYRWIPEASRLLRPGGKLIFLGNGSILMLCTSKEDEDLPVTPELKREYFGMHRFEWTEEGSVEFHLGYGDWIRLFRKNDFEVENLMEIRPSENATTRYPFVKIDWARSWPCEEVWVCSKKA